MNIKNISFYLLFTFIVIGQVSAQHSVRDIKKRHDPQESSSRGGAKMSYSYKAPKEALIKPLFMQSKFANIELPRQEGAMIDPTTGAAILAEKVTYTNAEVVTSSKADNASKVNLNEVQKLGEVVVTAKSRFTPERDGRVNVDFVVKVPKDLLSDKWRMTLNPQLLHNDSVVPLKPLVIKGQEFADKQKQDYADYDAYIKSIVNKSDYDKEFFDHDGVRKDIKDQQELFYEMYYKEWNQQVGFEKWKSEKGMFDAKEAARIYGENEKAYHDQARKAHQESMRLLAKGKDTTGVYAKYMKNFADPKQAYNDAMHRLRQKGYKKAFEKEYIQKVNERIMQDYAQGKDTTKLRAKYMKVYAKNSEELVVDGKDINAVPKKYRDLYNTDKTLDKVKNKTMTAKDSIEMAKHRYKFEAIAENEVKQLRKEEIKADMIPFPYEEGTRLDSVVSTANDFVYYYTQDYPVSQGLRKLRLTMKTKVDAIDRSSFNMPPSDTLSYFISSLSQLVDTSLIVKKTKLYREVYNRSTAYIKFASGKSTFDINYKDNKAELEKVIDAYKTFTTTGGLQVDSIELRVTTSLEGKYTDNADLSPKRAKSLKDYMSRNYSGTMNVDQLVKISNASEDWNTLAQKIKASSLTNKDAILDLLTSATVPDDTKDQIKKAYPEDYRTIRETMFPLLEKADFMFEMHRPGMTEATEMKTEKRDDYAEGLKLLQDKEYYKAIQILANYPDYNAALALLAMGYNEKANDVLKRLEVNGKTEYLRAIIAVRMNDDEAAITHLLKACELDPSKVYRTQLDAEIRDLVNRHHLQQQLVKTAAADDNNDITDDKQAETSPQE